MGNQYSNHNEISFIQGGRVQPRPCYTIIFTANQRLQTRTWGEGETMGSHEMGTTDTHEKQKDLVGSKRKDEAEAQR